MSGLLLELGLGGGGAASALRGDRLRRVASPEARIVGLYIDLYRWMHNEQRILHLGVAGSHSVNAIAAMRSLPVPMPALAYQTFGRSQPLLPRFLV